MSFFVTLSLLSAAFVYSDSLKLGSVVSAENSTGKVKLSVKSFRRYCIVEIVSDSISWYPLEKQKQPATDH